MSEHDFPNGVTIVVPDGWFLLDVTRIDSPRRRMLVHQPVETNPKLARVKASLQRQSEADMKRAAAAGARAALSVPRSASEGARAMLRVTRAAEAAAQKTDRVSARTSPPSRGFLSRASSFASSVLAFLGVKR